MGNRRILTSQSNKHFTKEEIESRTQSEENMKDIGLSFSKDPPIISGCKYGKALYGQCKGSLLKHGLLNDNTYSTFGILCYNYHMYVEACESTKNISKRLNVKKVFALSGEEYDTLSSMLETSLENEKMYFKHFRQLCGDFGFTPSSLLKLMDAKPTEIKDNTSLVGKLFG